MSFIKLSWDGKSPIARLINNNDEEELPIIYFSQSILDYFKSRDLLVQTGETDYTIENHVFLPSLNPELWEISQDAPATKSTEAVPASVLHCIEGTLLIERQKGKVKQVTCQLN